MELLPPPAINIKYGGFTLVELSIVMIIIGLLIGGIFGGMKLVDNANVQKTIQDLKSFDTAGLTFKDIYRALPGDMRNASTRLPNCTSAPCSTSGNGDRSIGGINNPDYNSAVLADTDERFVYWHHLQAAGLISMDFHNTNDMSFGEGQPASSLGGGYRLIFDRVGNWGANQLIDGNILEISGRYNAVIGGSSSQPADIIPCSLLRAVDVKIDDGMPSLGKFLTGSLTSNCTSNFSNVSTAQWIITSSAGAGQFVLSY